MKIIAATKYDYIVQMTPGEVRQLCPNTNISDSQRGHMPTDVGREIKIDAAWSRLRALTANRELLDKIIGQFKAMGELLQPVVTEVEQATTETAKDDWA